MEPDCVYVCIFDDGRPVLVELADRVAIYLDHEHGSHLEWVQRRYQQVKYLRRLDRSPAIQLPTILPAAAFAPDCGTPVSTVVSAWAFNEYLEECCSLDDF